MKLLAGGKEFLVLGLYLRTAFFTLLYRVDHRLGWHIPIRQHAGTTRWTKVKERGNGTHYVSMLLCPFCLS